MDQLNPIAVVIAMVVGSVLKNFVWKTDPQRRQVIPFINLAVLFLGKVALEISPAEAGVLNAVGGYVGGQLWPLFWHSALESLLASGVQSSGKASGRYLKSLLQPNAN